MFIGKPDEIGLELYAHIRLIAISKLMPMGLNGLILKSPIH